VKGYFLALACAAQFLICNGQTFRFKHTDPTDHFDIKSVRTGTTCVYRVSEKDVAPTQFRKVFLDQYLDPVDSVDYSVRGIASLVASGVNERFDVLVFLVKDKSDYFHFIVSEKSGSVHTSFNKELKDFTTIFNKVPKKIESIQLEFLLNRGDPEMLIVLPRQRRGSSITPGKIFALNANDGQQQWAIDPPDTRAITTTENEVVLGNMTTNGNIADFYDKQRGSLIRSIRLSPGLKKRDMSVFDTNGSELLVGGTERHNKLSKDGNFYVTIVSKDGEIVVDNVDTTARFTMQSMHTLGHVFDSRGNLLIIGEGWRPDYKELAENIAGSILTSAIVGGQPVVFGAPVKQNITTFNVARISTQTGKLIDMYSFPIGPWHHFSRFLVGGDHAVVENISQFVLYDPSFPSESPLYFVKKTGEVLIPGEGAPILIRLDGKNIRLKILDVDRGK
jgi:hypothetical protein